FYFERPSAYEPKAAAKLLTAEGARRLGLLIERLEAAPEFTVAAIEPVVRALTDELGLKLVDLAQLARLAVTGRTASPPLFDVPRARHGGDRAEGNGDSADGDSRASRALAQRVGGLHRRRGALPRGQSVPHVGPLTARLPAARRRAIARRLRPRAPGDRPHRR